MRAAVLHSPGDIRLETVPEPQVSADNVVVKVAACGVCGSDIPRMLSKGAHRMPLICGHEFSGHIVDIGRDVTGFAVGDLVAVPPLIACYRCSQCLRGEFSRCENYDYFGSRRDGAYSEFVAVPVTNLSKTPAGMDPAAAAMSDPAAIALHAVWKAGGCTVGDRGGIIGCGPIGLFAIQWLRLLGSNDVVAVDVSEQKLELARQAGATHTFLAGEPVDPDLLCDVVIEAAGIPASISRAIRMTARAATRPSSAFPRRRSAGKQDLPARAASGDLPARRLEFVRRTIPRGPVVDSNRTAGVGRPEVEVHDHA
jgi:L-iditol 2-dehydrogenase